MSAPQRSGGALRVRAGALAASIALLAGCGAGDGSRDVVPVADAGARDATTGGYEWRLPRGFPTPRVPADNPMSEAKVDLGRHLFYDTRLSGNGTQSCATCHKQELAFSDGKARAVGSTGEVHPRGSMGLANVAYATVLTWANDLQTSLERQALVPMFGEGPVELGLAGREDELLARLRAEPRYQRLFPLAFPEQGGAVSLETVTKALAAFERALISGNSPYDRAVYGGEPGALSPGARRGRELFFSERLECFHCHGGFSFADAVTHEGKAFDEVTFHNTGLYNVDGAGAYPADNVGLLAVSGKPSDMGRFKAPSLRNVAVTAPYMHDGSVATLEEALDHYAAGGRTVEGGPHRGVGARSPIKSELISGFVLTAQERADVVEFLRSLTDDDFLRDPRFADPWPPAPSASTAP